MTHVPSRWSIEELGWDLPCGSSPAAVPVESRVMWRSCEMEAAAWTARPTITLENCLDPQQTLSREQALVVASRRVADGIFQRRSRWPIILPMQHALLQCEFTILPAGGRLHVSSPLS